MSLFNWLTMQPDPDHKIVTEDTATQPRAEAVAGAGLPIDFAGNGIDGGFDTLFDTGLTGAGGALLYGAVLVAIQSYPDLRDKKISRSTYLKNISKAALKSGQRALPLVAVLSVLLALLPALGPVAAVAGVIGVTGMGVRIAQAFLDSLPADKKQELSNAADQAGLTIAGLTEAGLPQTQTHGKNDD